MIWFDRLDHELKLLLDAGLPYEMAFEIASGARLDRQQQELKREKDSDRN